MRSSTSYMLPYAYKQFHPSMFNTTEFLSVSVLMQATHSLRGAHYFTQIDELCTEPLLTGIVTILKS